jgi:hypothetical protein
MRNQFRQLVCWVVDQGSCLWVVMRQLTIFGMCCSVLVDLLRGSFLCNFHCILMYYIWPKYR